MKKTSACNFSGQMRRLYCEKTAHRHRRLYFESLEERHLLTAVGVTTLDAQAVEGSNDYGSWQITRTGSLNDSCLVTFRLNGTANGGDYSLYRSGSTSIPIHSYPDLESGTTYLEGSVTIESGSSGVTIQLRPTNDAFKEESETATIQLISYSCGQEHGAASGSASITIGDNDDWKVSIAATDTIAREPTSSSHNYATYTITRSNETDTGFPSGNDKVHFILWKYDALTETFTEVARDTVCFKVQDNTEVSDWIIPSGWTIHSDGSFTTPMPAEGAVGPKTEDSYDIVYDTDGDGNDDRERRYARSLESYTNGFELSFTYSFEEMVIMDIFSRILQEAKRLITVIKGNLALLATVALKLVDPKVMKSRF